MEEMARITTENFGVCFSNSQSNLRCRPLCGNFHMLAFDGMSPVKWPSRIPLISFPRSTPPR